MTNFLDYRFSKHDLTLKPGKTSGQSALCLVYADTRAYQDALDAAGVTWATTIQAVGPKTAIVALTVDGITRSASGEDTDFMSAEARAFKRACSAFGLGRYLYSIDLGFQPWDGKRFGQAAYDTLDKALAKLAAPWMAWQEPSDAYTWAISVGAATCDQHARNALKRLVDTQFGGAIRASTWPTVAQAFYVERIQRKAEKVAA
jgi:hypothetical protein